MVDNIVLIDSKATNFFVQKEMILLLMFGQKKGIGIFAEEKDLTPSKWFRVCTYQRCR